MSALLNSKKLLEGISPAPWKLAGPDDTTVLDCDRDEVVEMKGDYDAYDDYPRMEANARLIAASPRLAREHAAMKEALERMKAALKPFADASEEYGVRDTTDEHFASAWEHPIAMCVKVADFYNAAKAMEVIND